MQAGYKADQVRASTALQQLPRISDERTERSTSSTCPECGSQVFTPNRRARSDRVAHRLVADPSFPPLTESGTTRRHSWVELHESIQRQAPELWDSVRPLYDAGKYAEAAEKGRELLEARPDQAYLFYNVACCESLAGQTAEALEHLERAIDMWEGCRGMANGDTDFNAIREARVRRAHVDRVRHRRGRTGAAFVPGATPGRSGEPWAEAPRTPSTNAPAFDPLGMPDEVEALANERETAIVLTAPWHERDTQSLVEQLGVPVYAPPPDTGEDLMRKFGLSAEQVDGFVSSDLRWLLEGGAGEAHQFLAGDTLPFGVQTFPGWTHNDVVLWVESRRAVIAGDTLADFGPGIEINARWLRGGVTREHVADGLRPLLELPVERVLASHGGPLDRAALERVLA